MSQKRGLPARAKAGAVIGAALVGLMSACGSSNGPSQPELPVPPPRRGPQAMASSSAAASASAARAPFTPEDFTPSERNRDPFRSYPELFSKEGPNPGRELKVTKQVLAENHSLDELKLVAIVTGSGARAMFVDPEGKGWIVTLGQLIGRAETVRAGGVGGTSYDLYWKVDRIREGDVVFVRETPGRANVPTATRVISLRPEGDGAARK